MRSTHGFQPLAYSAIRYGTAAVIFTVFTARRRGLDADQPARLDAARDRGSGRDLAEPDRLRLLDQADDGLDDRAHPRDHADLRRARRVGARGRAAPGQVLVRGRGLFLGVALVAGGSGGSLRQRRRRPARGGRRGHVGRVQPDRRAADAPPLAVPDQRDRARLGWIPLGATASHQLATQSWDLRGRSTPASSTPRSGRS